MLKNQSGFTLIEMMVVMVIIGILVGVGAPHIMQARDNAEVAALQMELSGLQLALEQFYLDNEYVYPGDDEIGDIVAEFNHLQAYLDENNALAHDAEYSFENNGKDYTFSIRVYDEPEGDYLTLIISSNDAGIKRVRGESEPPSE